MTFQQQKHGSVMKKRTLFLSLLSTFLVSNCMKKETPTTPINKPTIDDAYFRKKDVLGLMRVDTREYTPKPYEKTSTKKSESLPQEKTSNQ